MGVLAYHGALPAVDDPQSWSFLVDLLQVILVSTYMSLQVRAIYTLYPSQSIIVTPEINHINHRWRWC